MLRRMAQHRAIRSLDRVIFFPGSAKKAAFNCRFFMPEIRRIP